MGDGFCTVKLCYMKNVVCIFRAVAIKVKVGYSKAPEQPQSSARPICHSHAMTSMVREPATICIAV